jgi:hypothetical protein
MGTPMSNLLVHLANNAGVPIEGLGDSTGVLDLDAIPSHAPTVPSSA